MSNRNEKVYEPEIWGGIECTINRVNNTFLDQFDLSGFYDHPEWIHDIVRLGIKTIRFPVLWEKHQPSLGQPIDWNFTANQLEILKNNNINIIAGLIHHGSGPEFTNLLDPGFPELFSAYASQVARQFPWIKDYTPVNEPLTTSRFSGLYGHWFPHKKNDVSFIVMLLNQLKGTILAIKEIKKINPAARFVQTEDLGKTYSTALLSYQANFENQRRWLTYDILCGKFDNQHPLWGYFLRLGINLQELQFFIDNPCPPDIIGVNHYITSERYLDDHIENYPERHVGGNGLHYYVDVEAVRVHLDEPHGLRLLLQEIWQRYKIPLAITEVHLHCTREEQLRWLKEAYETAIKLNSEGAEIRAVTSWALLGSFGWNKLLTCERELCEYETGAFDISMLYARPTALARFINHLTLGTSFQNAVLNQAGWWKSYSRYLHKERKRTDNSLPGPIQPLVIIGKTGTLGMAFDHICRLRNLHHYLLGRETVDINNPADIEGIINRFHPWAIINAAGYVKVDEAESNPTDCYKANFSGVAHLSVLCKKYKIKLVTFSSDLVFNGENNGAYNEDDKPGPLNNYGSSKLLAEKIALQAGFRSLIIRTSAFFGPWDQYNFATNLLLTLESGKKIIVPNDNRVSPTYVPHLVHATLDLLLDDATGIWHLANKGDLTWYQFAKMIALKANYQGDLIEPGYNMVTAAIRPRNSVLSSIKYNLMPPLEKAVSEYLTQRTAALKTVLVSK